MEFKSTKFDKRGLFNSVKTLLMELRLTNGIKKGISRLNQKVKTAGRIEIRKRFKEGISTSGYSLDVIDGIKMDKRHLKRNFEELSKTLLI
jgi:hypothetical protein